MDFVKKEPWPHLYILDFFAHISSHAFSLSRYAFGYFLRYSTGNFPHSLFMFSSKLLHIIHDPSRKRFCFFLVRLISMKRNLHHMSDQSIKCLQPTTEQYDG